MTTHWDFSMNGSKRTNWRHTETWKELEVLKDRVPCFKGMSAMEVYLKWEMKTEQVFACCKYSEAEKVKVAALVFKDHTIIWWDQEKKYRKRFNETPVATWLEMKTLMRKRYVDAILPRKGRITRAMSKRIQED